MYFSFLVSMVEPIRKHASVEEEGQGPGGRFGGGAEV